MKLFANVQDATGIHPRSDSVTLRWGYLFAQLAISTTVANTRIFFFENLENRKIKMRIELTRRWFPPQAAHMKPQFEKAVKVYDRYFKQKNKTQQDLYAMKKTEALLNSFFEVAVAYVREYMEATGITELTELHKDKVDGLAYFYSCLDEPEREAEDIIPLSKLLQLRDDSPGKAAPDDITFLLPMEFMTAQYKPAHICSPDDPEALNEDAIWLERVMELPNINAFDALELQVVRSQMLTSGKALHEAFRQWTGDAFNQTKTASGRLDYYRDYVRPAAAAWSKAAMENKLLNNVRTAMIRNATEVWMGEAPMQLIWDFYEKVGALPEATRQALTSERAKQRGRLRVPVVVLAAGSDANLDLGSFAASSQREEEPVVPGPSRRSISLD